MAHAHRQHRCTPVKILTASEPPQYRTLKSPPLMTDKVDQQKKKENKNPKDAEVFPC